MHACCVSRSGGDEDDLDGGDSCVRRLWLRPGDAVAASRRVEDADDEEAKARRSAETVARHSRALGSDPNLLVYMVSEAPEESSGRTSGPQRPRAHHIPPNTLEGVPIETESFVGRVIVMYKPDGGFHGQGGGHPYRQYFTKHRRAWEFRVQGRFKRVPRGDMYMGIVLRDFNYDQAVAAHSMVVKRAGMALVKYDLYLSWGDRCQASKKPDAELSHLVTSMTAWDQVIITPAGVPPPLLSGELCGLKDSGLNLERKEMGLAEYTKAIQSAFQSVNTHDTYTMCFWGVSQVIDLLRWNFKFGTSISMARFFEDDPIHVAMYELDPADKAQDNGRHLESRKRYFLDFMFWSTSVHCPRLPNRYMFIDAPEALERFSSSQCSCDGAFVADGQRQREEAPSVGSGDQVSLLSSWSNRLRWIPRCTCSRGSP